jgi:hypothetical protein
LARGPEGVGNPLPRGAYPVPVPDPGLVPEGENKEPETKDPKDPSIDSPLRGRRFSDDPKHLVDLWNEKAPAPLHRVHTLTDGLRAAIKLAFKQLPERRDWEQIMQEIDSSEFLQNATWFNFPWLVKAEKNETENYIKVLSGNYRASARIPAKNPLYYCKLLKIHRNLTAQAAYQKDGKPPICRN